MPQRRKKLRNDGLVLSLVVEASRTYEVFYNQRSNVDLSELMDEGRTCILCFITQRPCQMSTTENSMRWFQKPGRTRVNNIRSMVYDIVYLSISLLK
jgi:hypothetical protein